MVLESVLAGHGRDACPGELCYDPSTQIPVPKKGYRAPCCIPRQTKAPSIVGGKFR